MIHFGTKLLHYFYGTYLCHNQTLTQQCVLVCKLQWRSTSVDVMIWQEILPTFRQCLRQFSCKKSVFQVSEIELLENKYCNLYFPFMTEYNNTSSWRCVVLVLMRRIIYWHLIRSGTFFFLIYICFTGFWLNYEVQPLTNFCIGINKSANIRRMCEKLTTRWIYLFIILDLPKLYILFASLCSLQCDGGRPTFKDDI